MSDDGQRTGRQDAVLRYAGSLRCRPAPGAGADPGPEDWRFDILQAGAGIVVTEVAGEIDLRTVAILRKRLFELTDAGFARIIIDFENVRFCDAAGLGALVAAQNRLRARAEDRSRAATGKPGAEYADGPDGPADANDANDANEAGPAGAISLARVRPAQRRLLHIAGLGRVFALYESVPEAIRAQRDPTTAPLR
jgi:anti-anti-sigma regulatory factor